MRLVHMSVARFMAVAIAVLAFSIAGCEKAQQPPASTETAKTDLGQSQAKTEPEKTKAPAGGAENCAGFTAGDAAAVLDVPAARVKVTAEEQYSGFWMCIYDGGDLEHTLSFSVTISKDAKTAAEEMEQYRGNLEIAAGTAPFKDRVPSGAYSEISPLGDENVWTDVNGTLTVRKGAVSFQIQTPPGKMAQIKAAEAILSKL